MLKTTAKITMTGESIINDIVVCTYSAIIDFEKPEDMSVAQFQKNKELYKENREECRTDFATFEDKAHETQDAVVAMLSAKTNSEE